MAPVDHEAARAYRLQRCAAIIEALCVVDPATGKEEPCYEPDPDKPGSYRRTEAYQRIEEIDRTSGEQALAVDPDWRADGELTAEPIGELRVTKPGKLRPA